MSSNAKNLPAVIPNVLPFRGRVPVLPNRVNLSIPSAVWETLQECGDIASQRLLAMLKDEKLWNRMSVKDQSKLLELAFRQTYGAVDGSVKRTVHLHAKLGDAKGVNALSELAKFARREMPEFSPQAGDFSYVDAEREDEP